MEPKKYGLNVLVDLCSPDHVGDALHWHELRPDGLWLANHPGQYSAADNSVLGWHPTADSGAPALPLPFSAHQLAAFFLAGGGLFLWERFDFAALNPADLPALADDADDGRKARRTEKLNALRVAAADAGRDFEAALMGLGDNAAAAREVLRSAVGLRQQADAKFGRTDEGVRHSAQWLRAEDERIQAAAIAAAESARAPADGAGQAPKVASPPPESSADVRGRRLKRAALIDANRPRWPTIEGDLHDASKNGLSEAAKVGVPGFWWEGSAYEWARERGKLKEAASPAWPGFTHRIQG